MATPNHSSAEIDNAPMAYELALYEVERTAISWLSLRCRVERTGGKDESLNADYNMANMRMDYLLEELFIKMGELSTSGDS